MMAFCPEHPKWDQNQNLHPLSETTSIPTPFICEVPPPPRGGWPINPHIQEIWGISNIDNNEKWKPGRDPFSLNFRKFRSKTQWIGSVQPEKVRKKGATFWGGPLLPVGPVGILVEWIAPRERQGNSSVIIVGVEIGWKPFVLSWWPKRALAK